MDRIYIFFVVALVAELTGGVHSNNLQEKQVKRGDTVTLPCDIIMTTGSHINWFRNCSHTYQPRLIISPITMPRFSFQTRDDIKSYDLQIKDIAASDQGTYYCANVENKNGLEHYIYGNNITRVSLIEESGECEKSNNIPADCSACAQPGSPAPLPDCVQCWMMLYGVCAVCCLLTVVLITVCLSHVCLKTRVHRKEDELYSQGFKFKVCGLRTEHQCLSTLRDEPCPHTEVIYRLLGSSHTSLHQ